MSYTPKTWANGDIISAEAMNHLEQGVANEQGVTRFNSRDGDVVPQAGDYTAAMVGARADTWTPTAAEISVAPPAGMTATDVQGAVAELFQSVSEGKALIASAVTDKGVPTAADATFQTMHDNILAIESGSLPDNVRTITLIADPPEGGTVSGGGLVSTGMTLTINAEANAEDKYYFDGWEENGSMVSYKLFYTFPVTSNRTLIAKFIEATYTAGIDWWSLTLPVLQYYHDIAYSEKGKKFAIAGGANLAYSEDGFNWTVVDSPDPKAFQKIIDCDGTFMLITSYKRDVIIFTEDFVTFDTKTLPLTNYWKDGAYGNNMFVLIAQGSPDAVIAYSSDGATWKSITLPTTVTSMTCMKFANGVFVALGNISTVAIYSADGVTWKTTTLPISGSWVRPCYFKGKFITASGGKNYAIYSEDGITWTKMTLPIVANWESIATNEDICVLIARNTDVALYSKDGINWNTTNLPASATWYGLAWGKDKFVAMSSNTTGAYSSAQGPEA